MRRRPKPALDIGDNIVDVLDADGQTHIPLGHDGGVLLFRRQLRVCGRCGMNREAARVAYIGYMIEQFQRVDEAPARFLAAGEFEADQTAQSALEIVCGALTVDACLV